MAVEPGNNGAEPGEGEKPSPGANPAQPAEPAAPKRGPGRPRKDGTEPNKKKVRKVVGAKKKKEEEEEEEREPLTDEERTDLEKALTGLFNVMGSGIYQLATNAEGAEQIEFPTAHGKLLGRSWTPILEKYLSEGAFLWIAALGGTAFVGHAMASELKQARKGVKKGAKKRKAERDEWDDADEERYRRARPVNDGLGRAKEGH